MAGSPIAHSRSPVLHRAAYAALGLDWTYDAYEVDESGLPAFIRSMDADWAGASLTMPLKRAVIALVDELTDLARAVESVNTVLVTPRGLVGDNTDVEGIIRAVGEAGVGSAASCVVVGGGATAASAVAAAAQLGCRRVRLLVREPARAGDTVETAHRLGVAVVVERLGENGFDSSLDPAAGPTDLVVSTVPSGARGLAQALLPSPQRAAEPLPPLLDVVYAPWPTDLAVAWQQHGGVVVPGASMLLHQACRQVELMTGRPAPVEAMRSALPA